MKLEKKPFHGSDKPHSRNVEDKRTEARAALTKWSKTHRSVLAETSFSVCYQSIIQWAKHMATDTLATKLELLAFEKVVKRTNPTPNVGVMRVLGEEDSNSQKFGHSFT